MTAKSGKLLAWHQYTTTILTYDKLLTLAYLYLTLWWDTVKTAAASISLNGYNCKAIVHLATNATISCKKAVINLLFCHLS